MYAYAAPSKVMGIRQCDDGPAFELWGDVIFVRA
jgi:hypothetical protein